MQICYRQKKCFPKIRKAFFNKNKFINYFLLPYAGLNQQVQRVRFYLLNSIRVPPHNIQLKLIYIMSIILSIKMNYIIMKLLLQYRRIHRLMLFLIKKMHKKNKQYLTVENNIVLIRLV